MAVSLMFTAVAGLSSFQFSRSSFDLVDDVLTTKAKDQLLMWSDTPLGNPSPCDGSVRLDRLIYDGLEEDHAEWDGIVASRFGPGFDVDLVLDNNRGLYPIHGSGLVRGSGAVHDWWPPLDYAATLGTTNAASGTETMILDTVANHWGGLTKLKGEAVRMTASLNCGADSHASSHSSAASPADALLPRWF